MADKDVTLGMVLEHSQKVLGHSQMVLKHSQKLFDLAMQEMKRLHELTMQSLIGLKVGIKNIDERLDVIEIAIVEQNHEGRIRRLEKKAGFVTAA